MGIVLPGGLNMYYIDLAPNTEGTMHRTTSTDYLVLISGTLSLLTPSAQPYHVKDGKATYGEPVETVCHPGDVVAQRGMMHAYGFLFLFSFFFCFPEIRWLLTCPILGSRTAPMSG